jgi:cytochrome b
MKLIRIWDVPTRIFHWSLVGLIVFSWWSAEARFMDWHRYSGYTVLGLVVFRLFWGIFGGSTARFAHFVKGPSAIVSYLRSKSATPVVGHDPLGALSVLALLGLVIAQVSLGLFAVDVDGLESGPLSNLVSFEVGRACAKAHETVFDILLIVAALHIAAILFYAIFKRENLVRPMILGWKKVDTDAAAATSPVEELRAAPLWMSILGIAIASAVVWFVVK